MAYLTDYATMRSLPEPSSQVVTVSTAAQKQSQQSNHSKPPRKKAKRNPFTEVKNKSLKLYESLSWLEAFQKNEDMLLKKCVEKILNETSDYNEIAFKKDFAMKMSHLLNDRKFTLKCWEAGWSIFKESQKCVWAKDSVFQQIRDRGIEKVSGFKSVDIIIFEYEELMSELKALGFDEKFFEDDPYTKQYKEKHPEETGPRI